MRKISHIVVHCTAGNQKQKAKDVVAYHQKNLGWEAPGYHYIVEPDGTIVYTWPEEKTANGVKGYNATTIHVCYVGGIDSKGRGADNRTVAQKGALLKLLRELHRRYPGAKILGHRDLASKDSNNNGVIDPWERAKECPCFDAIFEYKDI